MTFTNAVSWFEIPTKDLARATKFYETIFDCKLLPLDVANIQMRMFPISDPANGVGGAIVYNAEFYKIGGGAGPLIYLNANPDVQNVLSKVEKAGGKVVVPKTEISPEHGHMAVFMDTEGNRVALHSVPNV